MDTDSYTDTLTNDLRAKGLTYLNQNCVPHVNYSVSVYLKNVSDVGDKIFVKHNRCEIDIETSVIAIEFDAITQKISKVEFGNFRNTLGNLINYINNKISVEIGKSESNTTAKLEKELQNATDKINSMLGNSYVVYDGSQILILDKLPKEDAISVMKINAGGIGFSQSGINGTFNSAWTLDGTLNMQVINAINLTVDLIKGGTLKLGSNQGEAGILELYGVSNNLICKLYQNGIEVFCSNGIAIKLNSDEGLVGCDSQNNKVYQGFENEFDMTKADVNEELTISEKLRFLPITTDTNTGVGIVAMT